MFQYINILCLAIYILKKVQGDFFWPPVTNDRKCILRLRYFKISVDFDNCKLVKNENKLIFHNLLLFISILDTEKYF